MAGSPLAARHSPLAIQGGLSLIEMAIAIALVGLLAAAAALFLRGPLAAQAQSQRQAELNDQASLAAEIMRRELTAAGSVNRAVIPGGFDLVAGAVSFRCQSNADDPVAGVWRRIQGSDNRILTRYVAYCHAEDPTTGGYAGTAGRDQRVSFAWVLCDRPRCEDGVRADVWQTLRVLP